MNLKGKMFCMNGFYTPYDSPLTVEILDNFHRLMKKYPHVKTREGHDEKIKIFVPHMQMGSFNKGIDIRFIYNHFKKVLTLNLYPKLCKYDAESDEKFIF